ncbi:C25 family cysteine peptidase [Spirosoma sp.]|uniref:putative type IX secretion system sortase PorU2 n=1 Tax=Spirosoma sp. TaxID=1899569 RepID=UPI003B3B616C
MLHSLVRLLYCVSVLQPFVVRAQSSDPDPTRWINFSQTYVKIPIAQNGLYRITATDLLKANIPISQVDPQTVQVFHRGIEQAIYVAGEADHRFDLDDFLEFYGRGNDGSQDSLLYHPRSAQPHSFYSLFSDTTAYFLTWRLDNKPAKRMRAYTDTAYAGLIPEAYHWAEELRLFTESYPGWAAGTPPKIEYGHYEAGEGYTGSIQQKGNLYTNTFTLTNTVRTGPAPQANVLLAGRNFSNHLVSCQVGPSPTTQHQTDTVHFSTYDNAQIYPKLTWNDVSADGQLAISTVSQGDNAIDAYSVSYIRLRYPQQLTAANQPVSLFRLERNAAGRSLVNVAEVVPGTRFWDISDPTAPVQLGITYTSTNSVRLVVQQTDSLRTILGINQPKSVAAIRPVTFVDWRNRKPNYLIISHETLMKPVTGTANAIADYAAYRASPAGGNYDTLTVTMQQLIDQYSYGERHPLAIRRFIKQLMKQSNGSLDYVLLIGRSRSTPGIRRNPDQAMLDMVMTAGFPGSDLVLTAGLAGSDSDSLTSHAPSIPIGRINAGTPQEVINYLSKVKEYESPTADTQWRKNVLHLSGGETASEITLFRNLVNTYRDQALGPSLGAHVATLSKTTGQQVEQGNVVKAVNEGVGLITFFGHSSLDVTDLDIGFCSNDALGYHNQGKYPILLVNGCAIGNFYFGRPTLSTDWVLTPNRGAIAAIAHSHLGYPDVMHQYSNTFYNLLTDSTQLDKSIGQLQLETIRRLLTQTSDGRMLAHCQQMVLQGDPAIRPFPFKTPDYVLTSNEITIQDTNWQPLRITSDSVQIWAIVQNAGQYRSGTLPVRVRRLANGHESGTFNWLLPQAVAFRDTLILTFPNDPDAEGINQFEITINPTESPSARYELNHTNNQAVVEVVLARPKPVLIFPAPNSQINTPTVQLTAYYAGNSPHEFNLEFDSTSHFNSPIHWAKRITATSVISYPATLINRPNTTYYWRVQLADSEQTWVTGSFTYAPDAPNAGLPEGQIRLVSALPTDRQQGDAVTIPLAFINLSPHPFADSLDVQQTIYAAHLPKPQITQWKLKALAGTDTLHFSSRISTEKLPGYNRIMITVNPRLQPEYSFLNNTLDLALPIQPDVLAPLLEVAVDGTRISNGSIVSNTPKIDVLVADENRSLIRLDTTGIDMYLQRPGKNRPFERLNWRNATVQPAGADNEFRVRYLSPMLAEGSYHLLVRAQDLVGNEAIPYQVHFQVVNARKLANLIVHPNPFRIQTRFAFTLVGEQPPVSATITLTDSGGRMVRQLKQPAHIGLNEWVWDGRADSGELLPAGVYIYKLVLSDSNPWSVSGNLPEQLSGRLVLIR